MSGRLQAVEHIHLECLPAQVEAMVWFYGEVCDFPQVAESDRSYLSNERMTHLAEGPCFRSARLELRIRVTRDARVPRGRRRLTVIVPTLSRVMELLDDANYPYRRVRGFGYTDRILRASDPAGHRVDVRQVWPLF